MTKQFVLISARVAKFLRWLCCIFAALLLFGGYAFAQESVTEESSQEYLSEYLSEQESLLEAQPLSKKEAAVQSLFSAFDDDAAAALSAVEEAVILRAFELLRQDDSLPSFGDGGAMVVEFSDYNCGYCKRMLPVLQGADVRVKVVEFPVLGELSVRAAKLALAAQKQGLYDEFHVQIMARNERLSEEMLMETVAAVGLDLVQLESDAAGEEVAAALVRNREFANMLSVTGTPFFLVKGKPLRGAVSAERFNKLVTE